MLPSATESTMLAKLSMYPLLTLIYNFFFLEKL